MKTNLTQEQRAVSEERKGTGAKPGHDLVIFEILDHGMQFVRVLHEGEQFKPEKQSWFGPVREYLSYAVNNNPNLRFKFSQRFNHMSASHFFDLSFTVRYRVCEPAAIVTKIGDDPLKMLQEEIKSVLGDAVAKLPWNEIIDSKLHDNFSVLAQKVTEGKNFEYLESFAVELGLELRSVDTVLNLTSDDTAVFLEETRFEREQRTASLEKQRQEAQISRDLELSFPRQQLARQNVLHEEELNRLRSQGELETTGFKSMGKAIEQIAAETRTPDGLQRAIETITRAFQGAAGTYGRSADQLRNLSGFDSAKALTEGSHDGQELVSVLGDALRHFGSSKNDPLARKLLSGILHWVAENYSGKEADEHVLTEYHDRIRNIYAQMTVDNECYLWLQNLLNQEELQRRLA